MNGHGGDLRVLAARSGREPSEILDFSANLNPFGPPSWLAEEISAALGEVERYPDPEASRLRAAAAERYGVDGECVVCSNGSDELFRALAAATGASRVLAPGPCYASYADCRLPAETPLLDAEKGFRPDFAFLDALLKRAGPGTLLFLGSPNNPTGSFPDQEALRDLALRNSGCWIVADEAFRDFLDDGSLASDGPPNLAATRSLTKYWTIPGLRVGLALCPADLARRLRRELSQWPVNVLAERVGARALRDRDFDSCRADLVRLRGELSAALAELGCLRPLGGASANYLLVEVEGTASADLEAAVLKRGVAVRDCGNFAGLAGERGALGGGRRSGWIRTAVRSRNDNARLVSALRAALEELL